ncbi:hypothetical protein LJK88_09930 [Paenibacillus sp. P26]|nr:hypothetical protein LJK88_09930 [Paenibacillus sp. P26]UUZ89828.1 hypothetical protein LJK87_27725 [Paenibacillus sp. P25]
MDIWKLGYDSNNYEAFNLVEGDWTDIIEKFEGHSLIQDWEPMRLKVYEIAPRSDAPTFLGAAPVFSERAVHHLKPLINNFVEILPADFEREEYFIINVLKLLDCIDYDRSKVVRFRSGRIMRFERYEFIPEVVHQQHIFKIIDIPTQAVFVSDEFKEIVIKSQLKGFTFEGVWSSK